MIRKVLLSIILIAAIAGLAHAQGTGGTQHTAALTWTAPSPVGGSGTIAGYNVYRLVPPATTYTRIATLVTPTNYTDSTVSAGTQYTYAVTTVDSNGNESVFSTAVTVTIPTNPNSPTGLTVTPHSGEFKRKR